jgi:UDP-galactopyranose mutase
LVDEVHQSGIRMHKYGPHYFRTSSEEIWNYVNRFDTFYKYKAVVKSFVNGKLENWPISASYIKKNIGEKWVPEFEGIPSNFEESALSLMPREIYEKFIKGYTEKQWGVSTLSLDTSLCYRFNLSLDNDPHLTPNIKYQGIPIHGYSYLIERMLEGIPILLNCNFLNNRDIFIPRKKVIFTGPIDEFFDFCYGRLAYRGQKRETTYISDHDYYFPCGQVNNPDPLIPYIRKIEWKHMLPSEYAEHLHGTVITKETPFSPINPDQYEYPFPDKANQLLHLKYKRLADRNNLILFCGRLGEYQYYDMDKAISRAMAIVHSILEEKQ